MNAVRRATLTAVAVLLMALAPAVAQAATISGTVSDEVTHAGIGGVQVCPTPQPYAFEVACVETDPSGYYYVVGLPTGQYRVSFSGAINNLPYVDELYDDAPDILDADLVTLSASDEVKQLDVELAQGGSISGTLTDEDGGAPIEGMPACAWDVGTWRCDKSDSAGRYQINGLPSGEYDVEYESWNLVNYQRELYEDAETLAEATRVAVVAPGITTGIDAELAKGAEILGHVSDEESGGPLLGVMVCAGEPPDPERGTCDVTDPDGNYALRGMPAGTYLIEFGVQTGPFSRSVGQWWDGGATLEEADQIAIAPPESRTGIDGSLPYYYGTPQPRSEPAPEVSEEAAAPPPPARFQFLPVVGRNPLPKCRKGFHRKLVKGKKRCVRKQGRNHHRPRRNQR
jgi:hypothetical protein